MLTVIAATIMSTVATAITLTASIIIQNMHTQKAAIHITTMDILTTIIS